MTGESKALGQFGEQRASEHLVRTGYRILERNVRLPGGEIDIVAQDGATLVVVEVRPRRSARLGTPEESITKAKAQRLARLGETYIQQRGLGETPWRIDVVAIRMGAIPVAAIDAGAQWKVTRLEHYKNAVAD
ncbi:MAG: YraN family protein [Dehalococcoidia bacterium]|nr:YraN family protein [Dehalococcoidia bacterium]